MNESVHYERCSAKPTTAHETRCASCDLYCRQCEMAGPHTLKVDPDCTACAGICPPRSCWRVPYAKQTLVSVPDSLAHGSWHKNHVRGTFEIRPELAKRTKYAWISKHQVARTDNRRGRSLHGMSDSEALDSDEIISSMTESSSSSTNPERTQADTATTATSTSGLPTSDFQLNTFGLDSLLIPNMLEEFSAIHADAANDDILLEDFDDCDSSVTTDSSDTLSASSTTEDAWQSQEQTSKRRRKSQRTSEPTNNASNKTSRLHWAAPLDQSELVWIVQLPPQEGNNFPHQLS